MHSIRNLALAAAVGAATFAAGSSARTGDAGAIVAQHMVGEALLAAHSL